MFFPAGKPMHTYPCKNPFQYCRVTDQEMILSADLTRGLHTYELKILHSIEFFLRKYDWVPLEHIFRNEWSRDVCISYRVHSDYCDAWSTHDWCCIRVYN